MKTFPFLAGALCAGALCVAGCTQAPSSDLEKAEQEIEAARKAGAETYAPSQLKAAQVSYELAMRELFAERRKLPFLRKYDKAVVTLRSAASAARSAQAAVETTRARIKTEVQDLLAQTKSLLDSADSRLKVAVKKKKPVGTLPVDLDSARIAAMNASNALGTGEFLLAKEKALGAREKAAAVNTAAEALVPPKKAKSPRKK